MAARDHYIQLSSLPEDVLKQVTDFIEFLMNKKEEKPKEPTPKKRPIGMFKGRSVWRMISTHRWMTLRIICRVLPSGSFVP